MEIKAITEMLEWVRHQAITRIVCLTDSMSTLVEISTGMLNADWTLLLAKAAYGVFSGFSVKRGAGRNSLMPRPARILSNQLLTGTISLHTLSWTLQRGEHLLECPKYNEPCSSPN